MPKKTIMSGRIRWWEYIGTVVEGGRREITMEVDIFEYVMPAGYVCQSPSSPPDVGN